MGIDSERATQGETIDMRVPTMILTLALLGGLGCAVAEKKTGAATQPTESWSDAGVSLHADISRDNGLTRIAFSWSGLKEPAILAVDFASTRHYLYDRVGDGGGPYGIVLLRSAATAGKASLTFENNALPDSFRKGLLLTVYLTDAVSISIVENISVKGGRSAGAHRIEAEDCPKDFVLVPASRFITLHDAFRNPPVTKLDIELPPNGGATVPNSGLHGVRAMLRRTIEIKSEKEAKAGGRAAGQK